MGKLPFAKSLCDCGKNLTWIGKPVGVIVYGERGISFIFSIEEEESKKEALSSMVDGQNKYTKRVQGRSYKAL